ncbi:MAG: FecR domain-containing protein [Phaeodactylibacter sp.]|nr:FecR domain-containing protein [Phaeodactylibacter sp.]
MEVSKYIMLFHKKLKGEINSQEQKEFSDWLEQQGRSGFTEELEKTWNLSKRYKEGYEPDVEAGLARLQQRIAASRKPRPVLARRWLSIAAVIALLAAIGWWWMGSGNAAVSDNPLLYTTGAGETLETTLPDGSTVVLNENSFLVLAEDFRSGSGRSVELAGEAYFRVSPNPSRPFRATTPDATVEVLGTAFNLRSYPGEGFTEVEVEEGTVRLTGQQQQSIEVIPGQRGICRPGQPMDMVEDPGLNAHSWRTSRLEFRNTPLGDVLDAVERHYKVALKLQNSTIRNCRVTSSFEEASLEEVLQTLSLILNLEAEPSGGNGLSYLLKGGSCEAGPRSLPGE